MTTQDIAKLAEMLNTLREVTGNHTAFTKKGVESYYKALQKFSISDIEKAIDEATETMRRMPSPADLKELIVGKQGRNTYKPYTSDAREVSMPMHVVVKWAATVDFFAHKSAYFKPTRLLTQEERENYRGKPDYNKSLEKAVRMFESLPAEEQDKFGRTREWFYKTGLWKNAKVDAKDEDPFEVAHR
jgi:hypothetical protein